MIKRFGKSGELDRIVPGRGSDWAGIRLLIQAWTLGLHMALAFVSSPYLCRGQEAAVSPPGTSVTAAVSPSGTAAVSPSGTAQSNSVAAPQSEIALQILHRSLLESVWGKPMLCEVRQNIRMFDRKRSSFGKYVRGGQGSGKMRLSLQVPAGDQMNSLLQVSDGELLYTLMDVGQHSTRTQVDLGKVRDRLTITQKSLQDPVVAMYLAIGGQAELLRKLCQQYSWIEVKAGRLGDRQVWWLEGIALDQPPAQHSLALIDVRHFEERAGLRPQRATLAIGNTDSQAPFWLYQVEETYASQNQKTALGSSQLTVTTEWDSPAALSVSQLVPDLFRLAAADSPSLYESRDETKLYLPPQPHSVAEATSWRDTQR